MLRLTLALMLLLTLVPTTAQEDAAREQPATEQGTGKTDERQGDSGTETAPKDLTPDIIDTTDKASEDLPLIFPADI